MLDTDLEGLNPQDATEYVLSFITTLKKTEKDLALAREDAELWARRISLAREKGETALADQAQSRLTEVLAKQTQLETEARELKSKVSALKQKLVKIRMLGTRSVDTDLLLAQLQMLTGEKDTLSDTFKEQEAAQKLEELKNKSRDGA
jgi:phage shock protein A